MDNLQLSFVCNGRRVSRAPLNYYIPGHASATLAHAAAHKARYIMFQNKLAFILEHYISGLNAGGAKVHLSCNNIR